MGRNGLFCLISVCKFGSLKNPFPTITSLSELYFRFRRFIFLVQTKKVISMNYGSSTSSWKQWRSVRLDLILSMRNQWCNLTLAQKLWTTKVCLWVSKTPKICLFGHLIGQATSWKANFENYSIYSLIKLYQFLSV